MSAQLQHENMYGIPPKEHRYGETDWDNRINLIQYLPCALPEDHTNTLDVPSQEDKMNPDFLELEICQLRGFHMFEKNKLNELDVIASLKILLQSGAKWDSVLWECTVCAQRPYHIICEQTDDRHELLDMMIEADNSKAVNTIDSSRCTPLMYAVREANLKCVKILIRNGADIDHVAERPDYNFELTQYLTPLIDAIFVTNRDIFTFLLESGVDVNKPDCGKRTPLMHAAYAGSVECVEKLLQKGARLDVTDQNGQCAWTYAEKFEVFKCMLDHGLDKNAIDSHGRSVLYFVVKKCNVSEVRYILEQGVTLATDIQIYTTVLQDLWVSHRVKSVKVAPILLDHGADPNKKTIEEPNVSLLHKAIDMEMPSEILVVHLIRNGADINFRSIDDRLNLMYPFEASVNCDNIFAAEALLITGCSTGICSQRIRDNDRNILWTPRGEIFDLMEEWNVGDNRVKSLMQICRTVILIQLSPAAYKKIRLLPLPSMIIKYLSIPELDDIETREIWFS